ncbi:MAG: DUF3592 domain-containing protein [Corallococcus sp.]|nr:DUF3592 domain-containing protein [Corallococcus sp.]MCM1359298.1 DUF3592 domain-containing protein [Corallococcus sp.]MCM1394891.1 DUF3592 domain-containing protein [Corallococcus sp.]
MGKVKDFFAFNWKGMIVSFILIVAFGIMGMIGVKRYYYDNELQKAIDKNIIVEAEIVALVYNSNSSTMGASTAYYIQYSYTDGEIGVIYEGSCGSGDQRTRERDLKRIGEKVKIYIGGVGKSIFTKGLPLSHAVSFGAEISLKDSIVLMSVGFSIIFIVLVLIVVYLVLIYGKPPKRKRKVESKQ